MWAVLRRPSLLALPALPALCITAVLSLASCASAPPPPPEVRASADAIVIGTTYTLDSKPLGEAREINVWLPKSYAKKGAGRYDVVYVLDGAQHQDFHHISGLAQSATINRNFDDVIVVGVGSKDRTNEFTTPPAEPRFAKEWPGAGGSQAMIEHLQDEVIPFIEGSYRVGRRRALMGESLAGLFVMQVLLEQPQLFTDYVSVSPSLWWDDRALAKRAPELIAKHSPGPRTLYVTMGDEAGTMRSGLEMVLEAFDTAPRHTTVHFVDKQATRTHSTIYHEAALEALRILFGSLPEPKPMDREMPWHMREPER